MLTRAGEEMEQINQIKAREQQAIRRAEEKKRREEESQARADRAAEKAARALRKVEVVRREAESEANSDHRDPQEDDLEAVSSKAPSSQPKGRSTDSQKDHEGRASSLWELGRHERN